MGFERWKSVSWRPASAPSACERPRGSEMAPGAPARCPPSRLLSAGGACGPRGRTGPASPVGAKPPSLSPALRPSLPRLLFLSALPAQPRRGALLTVLTERRRPCPAPGAAATRPPLPPPIAAWPPWRTTTSPTSRRCRPWRTRPTGSASAPSRPRPRPVRGEWGGRCEPREGLLGALPFSPYFPHSTERGRMEHPAAGAGSLHVGQPRPYAPCVPQPAWPCRRGPRGMLRQEMAAGEARRGAERSGPGPAPGGGAVAVPSRCRTEHQRIRAPGANGFFFISCPSVGSNSPQNFKWARVGLSVKCPRSPTGGLFRPLDRI